MQPIPVLNRAHPLVRGLIFCNVGGYPVDLVTGNRATFGGTVQTTVAGRTRYGGGMESTVTNGTQWVSFPDTYVRNRLTTAFTVVVAADLDSLTGFGKLFCIPKTSGSWSGDVARVAFDSDTVGANGNLYFTDGSATNWNPGVTFFQTGAHVYAATRLAGAAAMWADGKLVSSSSGFVTGAIDFSSTGTTIVLQGRSDTSTGESQDGRTSLAAMWSRQLTPAEIASLSKNPMQTVTFFAPSTPFLGLATPAGAAGYPIRPITVTRYAVQRSVLL